MTKISVSFQYTLRNNTASGQHSPCSYTTVCYTTSMDFLSETTLVAYIIVGAILIADLWLRIFLLFYIPKNRKPTAAMAWLLAIALAPLIGTALFFIIGNTQLSKRRRAMQRTIDHLYRKFNRNLRRAHLAAHVDEHFSPGAQLAESLTSLAPTGHNTVTILNGYDSIIHDMVLAINRATSYVYVEFFAMTLDATTEPFFDALEAATDRGVKVYVLFDTIGSRKYKGYVTMRRRLTAMGAEWRAMLPFRLSPRHYNRPDLRNHRKILVVDNTDAYLGSLNIIDKTYHRKDDIYYVELMAHVEGPAANEAAAVFAGDWFSETGELLKHFMKNAAKNATGNATVQLLPSGPAYEYRNNLKVFVNLINSARTSVVITNPYLVPDESLLTAITSAALRGVHVSILNSESMDQWMVGHAQRSYYEQLLKAGVSIHLYREPELVHSKYIAIDKEVAIIGSSNLDIRSFELNLECSVIAYDKKAARTLYRQHMSDLRHSHHILLEAWQQRSYGKELLDSIARLTSALQ